MKTVTKVLASVVAVATLVLQTPALQSAISTFFAAHSNFATIFGGILTLASLLHNPNDSAK
jgi:hypothetical protein